MKDLITGIYFFILFETDLNKIILIIIDYDLENNTVRKVNNFDNVNDFVVLGNNSEFNSFIDYIYML